MEQLPHTYTVSVSGLPQNNLSVTCGELSPMEIAPPMQFDGPGDQWSPEDLLMASISGCLVLSFRAIAKASRLEWISIQCESSGKLDKVERKILFTEVTTKAILTVPAGTSTETAEKLLHKAEQSCFITNSMNSENHFECEIVSQ